MKLKVEAGKLKIEFNILERILSFKRSLEIPLEAIDRVRLEKPASSWRDIRAPGTYLSGVIRAGTYYTPRGERVLVFNLREEAYDNRVETGRVSADSSWIRRGGRRSMEE